MWIRGDCVSKRAVKMTNSLKELGEDLTKCGTDCQEVMNVYVDLVVLFFSNK